MSSEWDNDPVRIFAESLSNNMNDLLGQYGGHPMPDPKNQSIEEVAKSVAKREMWVFADAMRICVLEALQQYKDQTEDKRNSHLIGEAVSEEHER